MNLRTIVGQYTPHIKNALLWIISKRYKLLADIHSHRKASLPTLTEAENYINMQGYQRNSTPSYAPLLESTKLLSIIVPVYNGGKYLQKCLLSLLNQKTNIEYEIVCVDDGSKDDSLEILYALKREYGEKIVVYHQNNGGIAQARNQGIALAKGEYVGFVDNDDTVSPYYIDVLINEAQKHQADIVQAGYTRVRTDGSMIYEDCVMSKMILNNDGCYSFVSFISGFIWTGIYKKALFEKVRFNVGYWFEDMITKLVIAREAKTAVVLNESLYHYTLHDGNSSKTLWKTNSIKSLDGLFLPIELYDLSKNKLQLPINEQINNLIVHELCWQLPFRMKGLSLSLQKAAFVIARNFFIQNSISSNNCDFSWNLLSKAILDGKFNRWRYLSYSECYKSKII